MMEILILFMVSGAVPVASCYLWDRANGQNHQAAANTFNSTLALVSVGPIAAIILAIAMLLVAMPLGILLGFIGFEWLTSYLSDLIFESKFGLAVTAVVLTSISVVRLMYQQADSLFEYEQEKKKIVARGS